MRKIASPGLSKGERLIWKQLAIVLLLMFGSLSSRAQFCGPYTHSSPLVLSHVNNATYSSLDITVGTSAGISLSNCTNIHITKCYFHDGTTVNGIAINAVNCTNITIDSCFFVSVATGLEAQNCVGGMVFNYNRALNMVGPYPRGQMVQFNNVSGAGNRITNNISQNQPGLGNYEDHINVYKSNGTAASPILIDGNRIYGGGPSVTGSGITIADQGGSYETATNNIVVNSGNIGMQIAGGTNIIMSNNTIYSKATTISHLGLGYANFTSPHVASSGVTISNNTVNWRSAKPADLSFYPAGTTSIQKDTSHRFAADAFQVPTPTGWSTNHVKAAIDSTVLSFPLWPSCIVLLPPAITYPATVSYTYGVPIVPLAPTNTGGAAGNTYALTGTLPAGLSFSTATGIISGTPTVAATATTYTVTATNSSGSDAASFSLTVNKAVLDVYADSKNRNYGVSNPALTISYSGFKFSDNPATLGTLPTASTTAVTGSAVGTYAITVSGAASAKYSFVYHAGTLSVLHVSILRHKVHVLH